MPQEQQTIDTVIGLIAIALLVIGLAATFSRKLQAWRDQFVAWRDSRAQHPSRVNRFDTPRAPAQAPRPEWLHMSSQGRALEHRIVAVPSTDTKAVPSPVPAKNDLTYDEAVRRAAAIKVNGKWWMSGKKLYSVVGGNHARFLEIVSEVRGDVAAEDVPAAPDGPPRTLRVRDSGIERHIPIDPELEYQPPNGI